MFESLFTKFPQIKIKTKQEDVADDTSLIEYSCVFHKGNKKDKFGTLKNKKYSCTKCANLLNRGHAFNLNGKPLEAKKIIEVSSFFNGKFDYSQWSPTDVFTPGIIGCPQHGEFSITLTDHVLMPKHVGCPSCLKALEQPEHTFSEGTEVRILTQNPQHPEAPQPKISEPKGISPDWLEKAKQMVQPLS